MGASSVPYVCPPCRRSFKKLTEHPGADYTSCPECSGAAIRVDNKFKPPPRQKDDQWKKVAALLNAGYRFESVNGKYPKTLAELPEFLATTRPRSINPHD